MLQDYLIPETVEQALSHLQAARDRPGLLGSTDLLWILQTAKKLGAGGSNQDSRFAGNHIGG